MIKSMTGFAAATVEVDGTTATATLKSVNHRFLDLQMRVPQLLSPGEQALRSIVQQRVARGRVELTLSLQARRTTTAVVELDEAFAGRLGAAIERARELGLVAGTMLPGDLLRFPQALAVREEAVTPGDDEVAAVQRTAEGALAQALDALDAMRRREGELLAVDIEQRRATLARLIESIAAAAETGAQTLQARLSARVQEVAGATAGDPALLAQEIVRFVARSDISEELVRFRAHLVHWRELGEAPEPCGRKFDFLLQEMNREINTIGSKAEGLQISPLIVEAKAELERMREQAQNIE
jgi:uncharacterized protein (TIGR00255 family)